MSCANSLTSFECAFDRASLPASISTWLAVTTMAAIWGSVGPAANATLAAAASARTPDHAVNFIFIVRDSRNGCVCGERAAYDIRCHHGRRRSGTAESDGAPHRR